MNSSFKEDEEEISGKSILNLKKRFVVEEKRQVRDLVPAIAYILFTVYVSQYYISLRESSKIEKLVSPFNSELQQCGFGESIQEKKYLYFRSGNIFYSERVCIEQCPSSEKDLDNTNFTFYPSREILRICFPESIIDSNQITSFLSDQLPTTIYQVFLMFKNHYIVILLLSMGLSYIYMFFVRQFSKILTITVLSSLLLLGSVIGIYLSFIKRAEGEQEDRQKMLGYLTLGLTICGMLGVVFYQKKLRTAMKVLRESSQFAQERPQLIFVSFVFCSVFILLCLSTLITACMIVTQVELIVPDSGFYGSIRWSPEMRNQILILLFWFIWSWDFLNGLETVLISHVCQNWFSKNDSSSVSKSLRVTFLHHFGSVAFGSFLSAILESTQLILNTVQDQLKISGLNENQQLLQNYLLKCLQCSVNFMQQVLKMVNESSYVLIAMKGESYLKSANEAADLIYSQSSYFLISQGLSKIYSVLGRLLIAVLSVLITNLQIDPAIEDRTRVIACSISFLIGLFASSLFTKLLTVASDTLLLIKIIGE